MDGITGLSEHLRQAILEKMEDPGICSSPVKDFFLARREDNNVCESCFERPLVGLVIQGVKHSLMGGNDYSYSEGQSVIAGIDMPISSYVVGANRDKPFLFLYAYLDKNILAELCMNMEPVKEEQGPAQTAISIVDADEDLQDIFLRLLKLGEKPEQVKIRGPMLMRELHFLLLTSQHGSLLRRLYSPGSGNNSVINAISWLKENFRQAIQVEHLARMAGMSLATLHRHFKTFTGLSPLQYQKQLRLYEAQRMMLINNEPANSAAYGVGYESLSQFNREYKKFFGDPPYRDIQRRREQIYTSN